jgi:hypothetical protein
MILSKKSVLSARYACFGLLIVLNAVICTVAVYNFTLAKELRLTRESQLLYPNDSE